MQTAEWAGPHVQSPAGDWLEIGVGPLGVGCTHFMARQGDLHILDPIEPTSAEDWELLPEPCKALVRSCQQTATMHVGQAEQLEFPDGTFALVAAENMLDHVEDPLAILRETRRVLMPGGHLLIAVDTFSALGEARFRLVTRRQESDTILVRAHPHRFSSKDLVELITAAGFRVTQADTPGPVAAAAGRHHRTRLLAV
jgi:SAM-dependent methyltransferase